MRLQNAPVTRRLEHMKNVILVTLRGRQAAVVRLLDCEITLHREVDDRGRDVVRGDCVLQQGAALAGCEVVRRPVLNACRIPFRIAPSRPIQPEHPEENEYRDREKEENQELR